MTDEEIQTHKEKIKKVMIDHLTTLGFPKISKDQVMQELKNMWIKFEEAGLVTNGLTFQGFTEHANNQFVFCELKDMLNF